jgi:hypothetical protein
MMKCTYEFLRLFSPEEMGGRGMGSNALKRPHPGLRPPLSPRERGKSLIDCLFSQILRVMKNT